MISLSLIEILYIVLIVAIVILTVYLATTLAKLKAVLEDVQNVSHLLSNLATMVDNIGTKVAPALTGLVAVVEHFAKEQPRAAAKAANKKKDQQK